MDYSSFSQLVQKLSLSDDWKNLNDSATQSVISFYRYWGNYLDPNYAFLTLLMKPVGFIVKALYSFTNALENIFNNMFKLFGLFGYLGNQNTLVGQFYHWFQILGVTIFTLLLVYRAVISLLGKKMKYGEVIKHFMLVTMVVAVLPTAITKVTTAMANDIDNIESVSTSNNGDTNHVSLALQPVKNNVVDIKTLVNNDFSTSKFKMDDQGYIKPSSKGVANTNSITDDTKKRNTDSYINNIDFSANFGATDQDMLEAMEKKHKGIEGLFLHTINGSGDGLNTVTAHTFLMKGFNVFEPVYSRYKVNWLGLFAQQIVLIILLISMSIKVVKSIFEMVLTCMIAPIQGYSSVSSSKKFKELLMTISGGLAGILFEIIIMRFSLEIMRDLPTLALTGIDNANLSGSFFSGLNMWEQCISSIIVYVGIFFGSMQGVSVIERWLGVSTGQNDTLQQVMGAAMVANAAGSAMGGLAHVAMGTGGAVMSGVRKAPQVAKGLGQKGASAVAAGGKGLSSMAGTASGVVDSVKNQGLKNTASAAASHTIGAAANTANGLKDGVKNKAGQVAGASDSAFNSSYDKTRSALYNESPDLESTPDNSDGWSPDNTAEDAANFSSADQTDNPNVDNDIVETPSQMGGLNEADDPNSVDPMAAETAAATTAGVATAAGISEDTQEGPGINSEGGLSTGDSNNDTIGQNDESDSNVGSINSEGGISTDEPGTIPGDNANVASGISEDGAAADTETPAAGVSDPSADYDGSTTNETSTDNMSDGSAPDQDGGISKESGVIPHEPTSHGLQEEPDRPSNQGQSTGTRPVEGLHAATSQPTGEKASVPGGGTSTASQGLSSSRPRQSPVSSSNSTSGTSGQVTQVPGQTVHTGTGTQSTVSNISTSGGHSGVSTHNGQTTPSSVSRTPAAASPATQTPGVSTGRSYDRPAPEVHRTVNGTAPTGPSVSTTTTNRTTVSHVNNPSVSTPTQTNGGGQRTYSAPQQKQPKQKNLEPSSTRRNFQKANQNFQSMKSTMDMGAQKMSASNHSSIKGVDLDDDDN